MARSRPRGLSAYVRPVVVLLSLFSGLPAIVAAQNVPQLTVGRLGEGVPPTIDGAC